MLWLTEAELPNAIPGYKVSFQVSDVVYQTPSGDIQVLDTPFLGRILVMDGVVQVAERDEFVYHEMLALLPALQHGSPAEVLIIGGGDGGALRQALKIPAVRHVTVVEISPLVVEVSQDYLTYIPNDIWSDDRVNLVYGDGFKFIEESVKHWDLIILDLTDPIPGGPSERLFGDTFLRNVKKRLTEGGVVSAQVGSLVCQPAEVEGQLRMMDKVFGCAKLYSAPMPSYQLSQFGFVVAGPGSILVPVSSLKVKRFIDNLSEGTEFLSPESFVAAETFPEFLLEGW